MFNNPGILQLSSQQEQKKKKKMAISRLVCEIESALELALDKNLNFQIFTSKYEAKNR